MSDQITQAMNKLQKSAVLADQVFINKIKERDAVIEQLREEIRGLRGE